MARRAPLVARGGCAGRRSDRRRRLRGEANVVGFEEEADAGRAAAARTDEARRGIDKEVAEEELLLSALARPGAGRAGI